ncbi:MAG: polysaccharide pyruvyl transferase family protein [Clostridia bacterium]|nr:polysaccharide pyruvyl transferase family protein [Clostridia bacterium]
MKCIVIIGGQLYNKGAESMTFTVIDEIVTRHPNKKIVLFSNSDYKRNEADKNQYKFNIAFCNERIKFEILGGVLKLINRIYKYSKYKTNYIKNEQKAIEIFKNAEMIIDISGFALSSQRGFKRSLNYMLYIMIGKKFRVPTYIMPQSFGPFDYNEPIKTFLIKKLMKKYLSYPKVIFAREKEGYEIIKKYTKDNLQLSTDVVLQRKEELDIKNIYNSFILENNVFIKDNSVALIPNSKIMNYVNEDIIYRYYKEIIIFLVQKSKSVYLMRHSTEDIGICKRIKQQFSEEENVILLEQDFNCFEINQILPHFSFIIASRYHAIIHAYRNGVPVIALGWAVKYKELLSLFDQQNYLFDVRKMPDMIQFKASIDMMLNDRDKESNIIKEKVKKVQDNNIFNVIF